jgi:DNA segregation ATPase FtsK/SpoIIIE, S-DNA-T family
MAKPASRRSRSPRGEVQEPLFSSGGVTNWWDGEALGLILLGFGVVLSLTMYAPDRYAGILGILKSTLQNGIGWSAYLLPALPIAFGLLMVLRRTVQSALRVAVGAVIVVLALLVATAISRPDLSGGLPVLVTRPLRPIGPLMYLIAALVVSLGTELMLAWTPTTIARTVAKLIAVALAWSVHTIQTLVRSAQEHAARMATISRLRNALTAHIRDIQGLERLYPGSNELSGWKVDAQNTLVNVASLDERGFSLVEKDLAGWSKLVSGFTTTRAKELAAQLPTEDVGASPVLDEAKRVLGTKAVTGSGAAAKALEGVRRALQLDADTLLETAKREKRDRDAAAKVLGAGIRPRELSAELERHKDRVESSQELLERAEALLARVQPYPGWPEFVARLEKPASVKDVHPEILAFTNNLAQTLRNGRADALPELMDWTNDLDALEAKIKDEAAAKLLEASAPTSGTGTPSSTQDSNMQGTSFQTVFSASGLGNLASGPFTSNVPNSSPNAPEVYEAVFEMDFPGGPHVSAEDIHALISGTGQDSGLEIMDLEFPDENAPWVSPTERAAAKIEEAKARNLHSKPKADGIADSNVGERLKAPTVPVQGGIPIAIPGFNFLDPVQASQIDLATFDRDARTRARIIDETFGNFGIQAKVVDFARGPTVTRYEVEPAPGEKISRVQSVQNDLARVLAVGGVRIEAPVPGKNVIGLEVPNAEREPVTFRTGIESNSFSSRKAKLPLLLGKSIDGEMVIGDLAKMPHLLIAGSTGSGKSVCVNTLIMSLLFRYLPTELRFIMVDPKMVELTPYDGIPHLVRPVVTNPMDAAGVLLGCVGHMERRYKMMSEVGAKNLEQYNEKARATGDPELPYLVIIIDELADLMITSPKEVEASIMRLAQMARATGMHLILATQRPSADVVTGLIKVNIPARVAFAVSSGIDSRTILDSTGAERLTGYGDMLFYQPGLVKSVRLQGPYISEAELERITEFLRRQFFDDDFGEAYGTDFDGVFETSGAAIKAEDIDFADPLIKKAAEVVIDEGYAAVSRLQRRLSVGHARAGKLIDALEAMGIVGPYKGSKSREVIATRDQLPDYFG